MKRTRTKIYNEESWQAGRHSQTPGYIQKQPCHLSEETGVQYNSCVLPAMTYGAETWTLTKQAQNKLAAAQTKMERSMLNITYKDIKTNIWVRKKTTVIDIINTVRKNEMVLGRAYLRLKDDRCTSRITTLRPCDKKRRQGRPAKRWRDDLDKYWSDTIWQRTGQDRVIRRRHDEAFAQPQDTCSGCLMMMMMLMLERKLELNHPGQCYSEMN